MNAVYMDPSGVEQVFLLLFFALVVGIVIAAAIGSYRN